MDLIKQKYLRFIIPGLFLYGLLVALCWTTRWCNLAIPSGWEEVSKLLTAIVLGAIYNYVGLRERFNRPYYDEVNAHIVKRLTSPFTKEIPGVTSLAWRDVRILFYRFIDKDETLSIKSKIVRFNGLLWTSVADLRAVSVIGALLFLASVAWSRYLHISEFDENRAAMPVILLILLTLLTFWFSRVTTDRHKHLSDEQIDYILHYSTEDLRRGLERLAARGGQVLVHD